MEEKKNEEEEEQIKVILKKDHGETVIMAARVGAKIPLKGRERGLRGRDTSRRWAREAMTQKAAET